MASDKTLNHEYLPIQGLKDFYEAATKLALGSESTAIVENRVCIFSHNVYQFYFAWYLALCQRKMSVFLFSFSKSMMPYAILLTSCIGEFKVIRKQGKIYDFAFKMQLVFQNNQQIKNF